MRLDIGTRRWAGVPFYLRAGKRLGRRVTEIAVVFKRAPQYLFAESQTSAARPERPRHPRAARRGRHDPLRLEGARRRHAGARRHDGLRLRPRLHRGEPRGLRATHPRRAARRPAALPPPRGGRALAGRSSTRSRSSGRRRASPSSTAPAPGARHPPTSCWPATAAPGGAHDRRPARHHDEPGLEGARQDPRGGRRRRPRPRAHPRHRRPRSARRRRPSRPPTTPRASTRCASSCVSTDPDELPDAEAPARRRDPRRRRRRRERGHRPARLRRRRERRGEPRHGPPAARRPRRRLVAGRRAPTVPGESAARPHRPAPHHRCLDAAPTRRRRSQALAGSYTPGRHRLRLDPPHAVARAARRRARPAAVRAGHRRRGVTGAIDSPSTALLAAWLQLAARGARRATCSRRSTRARSGIHGVRLDRATGAIELERDVPGHRHARASRASRRTTSRSPAGTCATASPRSCAGSTPTSCTVKSITSGLRAARRTAPTAEGVDCMTNERRVLVHPDKASLAGSVAARFITKMRRPPRRPGEAHVVLTGGTMGTAVLAAINASPARDSDRLVAGALLVGRRALAARTATPSATRRRRAPRCSTTSTCPTANVHPFPASDVGHRASTRPPTPTRPSSPQHGVDGRAHPRFDITFLGVGPDGHIASLFPRPLGHPASTDRTVDRRAQLAEAAAGAPQPHPARSSTRPSAIWLVLAGADKASALGLALAGASRDEVPVAGVKGRKRTVFFVDAEAAAEVPETSSRATTDERRERSRVATTEHANGAGHGRPRSTFGVRSSVLRRDCPRRARSCVSASSRSAAASSSVRRSFTYARCVLYGSSFATDGGLSLSRPAGRPVDGQSMMSGISSSGRFAAK